MSVQDLTACGLDSDWDGYVRRHRLGSPFHLLAWRDVVTRSFGLKAHYLAAESSGVLVGVLPMVTVRNVVFERSLVSVPYGVRGGVLADSPRVAQTLIDKALELAGQLDVDYLELRSQEAGSETLENRDIYVTFQADLRLSAEEIRGRMERKRRQMMNYVQKVGYEARTFGVDKVDEFYHLFCLSMRSHGTPVLSKKFIREILSRFGKDANLYFVYLDGALVAGVLNLFFEKMIMPFYFGADRTNRPRGLDDFTYWSLMNWAREQGYETFDFGRSRVETGPYRFKRRWGMDEIRLDYQYQAIRAGKKPDVTPDNPKFGAMIDLWRRLPLPVTQLIGPRLAKRLP